MNTKKRITSSTIRRSGPPAPVVLNFSAISAANANGRRAMIPIMMMREIPFPIPRSVMRSPSHITNIVPPRRITVDTRLNQKLLQPSWLTAMNADAGIWL